MDYQDEKLRAVHDSALRRARSAAGPDTLKVMSGYSDHAHESMKAIRERARSVLGQPDVPAFDTVVGTGQSALLILPILADEFKVNMLAIRKPNEASHAFLIAEGHLGHRWLFVDDHIASGATLQRVMQAVEASRGQYESQPVGMYLYGLYNGSITPGGSWGKFRELHEHERQYMRGVQKRLMDIHLGARAERDERMAQRGQTFIEAGTMEGAFKRWMGNAFLNQAGNVPPIAAEIPTPDPPDFLMKVTEGAQERIRAIANGDDHEEILP